MTKEQCNELLTLVNDYGDAEEIFGNFVCETNRIEANNLYSDIAGIISQEIIDAVNREKAIEILRHIFDARIDNCIEVNSYTAWTTARDIVEYFLAGNIECLRQFDCLETKED
jgi:hypothetical protein